MRIIKNLFVAAIFLLISACAAIITLYIIVKSELPSVDELKNIQLQTPMKVFSTEGELISQFGEKRRIPVELKEIPIPLIQAFLAIEDSRFYDHIGVDFLGLARAVVSLALTGEKKQGGSTITMQVARNLYLSSEKTYIRKIKEIFIALYIEQILTKDEILTLYLNKIALGNRAYGVGAASQVYYGKSLQELTLAQMATLAGLPKAPSTLNPIRSPERALQRRNIVLGRMHLLKMIGDTEFKQAQQAAITAYYHGAKITVYAPYIAEMARQFMVEQYGENKAYTEGFQVFLTVNAAQQIAAEKAIIKQIHAYDERHGYRGIVKSLWDINTDDPDPKLPSTSAMLAELKQQPSFGGLEPAIVLHTFETSAEVLLMNNERVYLEWDEVNWARSYINDLHQDAPPKNIADVIPSGSLIYVYKIIEDDRYRLSQIPEVKSALVALDPNDGAIKALVGGYHFKLSQYNRVTQAKRQVGSTIKPFIYSAALHKGFTLASVINDAPINFWDQRQGTAWRPKNSPEVYEGPIRIRQALAKSKNVVSVRLLRGVGMKPLIDYLTRFGFNEDELPANETLALGSASLTPLEMARAGAAVANNGFLVTPYLVKEVKDLSGKVVYQPTRLLACDPCIENETYQNTLSAPQVISEQNAFLMREAMKSNIQGGGSWRHKTAWLGTGWRAKALKRNDLSGKTGTTNDSKDTWYLGFNPQLLALSWVGFDNPGRELGRTEYNSNLDKNQVYGGESGAKTAQPAWIDFMKTSLPLLPTAKFSIPNKIVSTRIDNKTGLLAKATDHSSQFEYFIQGTEPTQFVKADSVPIVFDSDDPSVVKLEESIFE